MAEPSRSGLLQPGAKATLSWATEAGERKIVSTVRPATSNERLSILRDMAAQMGLQVSIQLFHDISKEPI